MKVVNANKNIFSTFLFGVYIFAAFFSANFHQHSHGIFGLDDDGSTSKVHKVVEKSSLKDCFVCHFLTHKTNIGPQEFQYNVGIFADNSKDQTYFSTREIFSENATFHLRGPPEV